MITVEDTIEILAGVRPRTVNIRIDKADAKIILSLGRQMIRKTALTDRQFDLAIKKIEKYQDGLERCGIDVDQVLTLKTLKWPIREIDRTQTVYLSKDAESNKPVILVKYVFSKKFAEIWAMLEDRVTAVTQLDKTVKQISYTEKNLYLTVIAMQDLQFEISEEIYEIFEKIEKIMENPENVVPYVTCDNENIFVANINPKCKEYLDNKFDTVNDSNVLEFVDHVKHSGIFLKSQIFSEKLRNFPTSDLTKKILLEPATRFRLDPEKYSMSDMVSSINTLNQWPLLVILEENSIILDTLKSTIDELSKYVPIGQMNVFFRLKNEQKECGEFNQYVKDNGLNNYIDKETKVVFISRNRIPKPLLKSEWQPRTAILASNHDFGKLSAYLNDFSTVYYYNNSITMRNNRLKGADKIVQL
jgi:hypothetical protein